MSITQIPVTEALTAYVEATLHFPKPLSDLVAKTKAHPQAMMLTHPAQIQFMTLLMKAINAKNVIEVGVFTGCTTLAIALTLPSDGHIIACDIDEQAMAVGQPYWEAAKVTERITVKLGPALDSLKSLVYNDDKAGAYDAVYIDANKKQYPDYYEATLPLLRQGGLLLFDNLLQSGKVADSSVIDEQTTVMRALTEMLATDTRVDFSLLTIGDGLGIAYKR